MFDKVLIAVILISIAVVMADSVEVLNQAYGSVFQAFEWAFTLLFTAEYIARLERNHPDWQSRSVKPESKKLIKS